jgi:hypothetical protein
MSLVLLASSMIYKLTGFGFLDSIGALGLIYFSLNEGRESLKRARGMDYNDDYFAALLGLIIPILEFFTCSFSGINRHEEA